MNDKSLPQKESDNEQKLKKAEIIELEQELLSVNPRIFDGIKKDKKEEILRSFSITLIQEKSHSRPLPDAETLIQYNSVIPNGADRIMSMAEKQQNHRISIETQVIISQNKQSGLGQVFGLIIGLFGISCGTFLAYSGEPTVGGIIAGGTVVSLVSVFVIGKTRQKKK